jgi:hypothetical protein
VVEPTTFEPAAEPDAEPAAEPDAEPAAGPDAEPAVTAARLRLGLVLPDGWLPRWLLSAVEAIRSCADADVVVMLRSSNSGDGRLAPGRPPGAAVRTLLRAYREIDRRVFGRPRDPAELADPGAVLAGIPSLEVNESDSPESIAARLHDADLDVLVRFAWPELDRVAQRIARYGVWSVRVSATGGPGSPDAALPIGLTEVIGGSVVTLATLDVSCGPDRIETIAWTVSATDRVSVVRGMRGHLAKVAHLVPRALRDLRRDGRLPNPPAAGVAAPPAGPASAARLAGQFVRLGLGYAFRLIQRKVAADRWIVALTPTIEDRLLPDPARTALHHLEPPAGRSWADPFLVRFEGRTLLFVEEWLNRERRGRIALVRLDDALRPSEPETVLAVDGHLSYPQVFAWRDTWYLLPEQAARGGLQLYRAESFPTTWIHDRTLIAEPPLADATVAEIDGRWWLFAAAKAPGGTAADELLLFSADQPIGPWRPHPRNPVLSDIRSARPAGPLIRRDGRWYRPSQDGSVDYGWAMSLNRIERLDDEGYLETRVARLEPGWGRGIVGTHTLSEADGLTAIDLSVRWRRAGRRRLRTD